MNVQPNVEGLEERAVPSATASGGFQQPFPAMETPLQAGVQALQSILQTDLNQLAALAPVIPAAYQPAFNAALLQEQQVINLLPVLANFEFEQGLVASQTQGLAQNTVVFPGGFFPFGFFPGFLGYPGFGFGGLGLGGLGYSGLGYSGLGSYGFPGGFGSGAAFGSTLSSGFAPMGFMSGGGLMMSSGALTFPDDSEF